MPQEYKRKYAKSEVSSLSKQGKKDNNNNGQEKEKGIIAIEPSIKTDATWISNYGEKGNSLSATNHQLQDELNTKEFANHGAEPEVNDKYESVYSENYRLRKASYKGNTVYKSLIESLQMK